MSTYTSDYRKCRGCGRKVLLPPNYALCTGCADAIMTGACGPPHSMASSHTNTGGEVRMTRKQGIWLGVTLLMLVPVTTMLASDNSGEYGGGHVMPRSLDGVNPVFHPRIFGFQKRVYVPQPQAYCFVHGPNGWYVDCNANSPASLAAAALQRAPALAKATPKVQVARKPVPRPVLVHKPINVEPPAIDNRIAQPMPLPPRVVCLFC